MNQLIKILIFTLLPLNLFAQWNLNIEGGGSIFTGNVDKSDLKGKIEAIKRDSLFEFQSIFEANRSQIENKTTNNELNGVLKYDYKPLNKITPFVMAQGYKNQIRGIQSRYGVLTGLKLAYIRKENLKLSISGAILYDYENKINKLRYSIRPKFTIKLWKLTLKNVTFLKILVKDLADYKVESVSSLEMKISKKAFLKLNHKYFYDAISLMEGIERTDNQIYWTLKIKIL